MKFTAVPKKFFSSPYRKEMWRNARRIVSNLERTIPISRAYVMGSFTTEKERPGDVDFIILLKIPERKKNAKWCVDLVIAPDNPHGAWVLKDEDQWVKEKYGLRNSTIVRIK